MFDAVLFDLDDTLFDHRGAVTTAVQHLIDEFPASPHSPDDLRHRWVALEQEHMDAYAAGDCSFTEQRRRRARAFLPLLGEVIPDDDASVDAWFTHHYLRPYRTAWSAHTDAGPCLAALSGLSRPPVIGVVTNGDPEQQRNKLDAIGLASLAGQLFTPTELGRAKPHRAAFLGACARLKVLPERTAFVGDSLRVDALGASAAGLVGVWLDRDGTGSQAGTDATPVVRIRSLLELTNALASGNDDAPGHP